MISNNVIGKNNVLDYRTARAEERDAWRRAILDRAGQILADEGTAALTLRHIAAVVGCSTTVLYTFFGDKAGLIHELYLEGFARLRAALEAVPAGGAPLDYLAALAWAYRANARANAPYYGVMFERALPGFTPPPESVSRTHASFVVIVEAIRSGMAAGVIAQGDPVVAADLFWAAGHGLVSLERAGYFPDPAGAERRYRAGIAMVLAGLRHGVAAT